MLPAPLVRIATSRGTPGGHRRDHAPRRWHGGCEQATFRENESESSVLSQR